MVSDFYPRCLSALETVFLLMFVECTLGIKVKHLCPAGEPQALPVHKPDLSVFRTLIRCCWSLVLCADIPGQVGVCIRHRMMDVMLGALSWCDKMPEVVSLKEEGVPELMFHRPYSDA